VLKIGLNGINVNKNLLLTEINCRKMAISVNLLTTNPEKYRDRLARMNANKRRYLTTKRDEKETKPYWPRIPNNIGTNSHE